MARGRGGFILGGYAPEFPLPGSPGLPWALGLPRPGSLALLILGPLSYLPRTSSLPRVACSFLLLATAEPSPCTLGPADGFSSGSQRPPPPTTFTSKPLPIAPRGHRCCFMPLNLGPSCFFCPEYSSRLPSWLCLILKNHLGHCQLWGDFLQPPFSPPHPPGWL